MTRLLIGPEDLPGSRDWPCKAADQVPSLVGAILSDPELVQLVLVDPLPWSQAHVLAAGKQLQGRGGQLYLIGSSLRSSYVRQIQALGEITKPAAPGGTEKPQQRPQVSSSPNPAPPVQSPAPVIRPLQIPPDLIYSLAVAGSQARIGCTTQALGLWRWARAVGFMPAVVVDEEEAAALAACYGSQSRRIAGGFEICGIPMVSSTALAYDCYIYDLGVLGPETQRLFSGADWSILVSGIKPPGELRALSQALAAVGQRPYLSCLCSFATPEAVRQISDLFGGRRVLAAPWAPDPFDPGEDAVAVYDRLLRPVLLQMLRQGPEQGFYLEEERK